MMDWIENSGKGNGESDEIVSGEILPPGTNITFYGFCFPDFYLFQSFFFKSKTGNKKEISGRKLNRNPLLWSIGFLPSFLLVCIKLPTLSKLKETNQFTSFLLKNPSVFSSIIAIFLSDEKIS